MVQGLSLIVPALLLIACTNSTASCSDSLLLSSSAGIEKYGLDTSGHWYAITRPFAGYQQLIVDGKETGVWDTIQPPIFSFDGSAWATTANRSGQWFIVTDKGTTTSSVPILQIRFPSQSSTLWWVEKIGATFRITNGDREYVTTYPVEDLCTDPQGLAIAWKETRLGIQVIYQNGVEVARGSVMSLYGVWVDGRCLYTSSQGQLFDLLLGTSELVVGMRSVYVVKTNPFGTVAAWQTADAVGQVHTYVYTDEYLHPWEAPVVSAPDKQLALSPFDPLVAYRTVRQGSKVVGYNSAFYPAGVTASPPVFSNDGAIMVYGSKDNSDFVVVNGKRHLVNAGVPTTDVMVVNQQGNYVAWCSPTTLVVVSLDFNKLTLGRMCDTMGTAIYNRRKDSFMALGTVSGHLYLLSCEAY